MHHLHLVQTSSTYLILAKRQLLFCRTYRSIEREIAQAISQKTIKCFCHFEGSKIDWESLWEALERKEFQNFFQFSWPIWNFSLILKVKLKFWKCVVSIMKSLSLFNKQSLRRWRWPQKWTSLIHSRAWRSDGAGAAMRDHKACDWGAISICEW